MDKPSPGTFQSKAGRLGLLVVVLGVLLAGAAIWLTRGPGVDGPKLDRDIFVSETTDAKTGASPKSETVIGFISKELTRGGDYASLKIDYPLEGSIFPPDMVAPTFLWHDSDCETNAWLVDISFETVPHHIYALVSGARTRREIDTRCVTERNTWNEPPYQASAKGWTPDEHTWGLVKRHSRESKAVVTIFGLRGTQEGAGTRTVTTQGSVRITTSKDPVGAQIFYRDVPLMPSETKDGFIKPLANSALPLIQWRLRNLSKRSAPVVMQHLPTCANCHTFSRDGQTLAMDMDGPAGDKGAHAVIPVSEHIVVKGEDVFTWNSFTQEGVEKKYSFGMFPQVSPDGEHVLATVHESVYVQNYMAYQFLQTFYPTRGILAIYNRRTGEIKSLPGADDPRYVQSNGCWSPDGKEIIFIRAEARPNYEPGPRATYANDPNETQIQYDIYRIPFNGGEGGVPEPVVGASQNGISNSFPRFSPDGKWIVYVQCKNGLLQRPDSKLHIIPAEGGTARLMNCNTSLMNSWHSWSPNSRWLVFSSKANTPYTEMFLTHVDDEGNDSPAILIPNSTAANRAVNLPEFANIPPEGIAEITTPAVDYHRHLDKAKELKNQGQFDEAVAELKTSLEMKADYPNTYVVLANILSGQGKVQEAAELYRKAIDLNPNYFQAHNNLGVALRRLGQHDEALIHYKRAVAIYPIYYQAHNNIGSVLNYKGEYDEAIRHFEKAVEVNPRVTSAHYNWGVALMNLGRADEGIVHFRKAVEIAPRYDEAHCALGAALAHRGKAREGIGHLRQAIEINPQYLQAYSSLALILATDPDPALRSGREAVRLAETACKKTDYGNAAFLDCLAAAYAETGRFDDAVRTAEKALAIARQQKLTALAPQIETHLGLFRKRQPVRQPK